jgi:hypothetical protein
MFDILTPSKLYRPVDRKYILFLTSAGFTYYTSRTFHFVVPQALSAVHGKFVAVNMCNSCWDSDCGIFK